MITMNYNEQSGLCVYEDGALKYRAENRDQIRELQIAVLWGLPVELNGLKVRGDRQLAQLGVMAAQAWLDGL